MTNLDHAVRYSEIIQQVEKQEEPVVRTNSLLSYFLPLTRHIPKCETTESASMGLLPGKLKRELLQALVDRIASVEEVCGELFNRAFPNRDENEQFVKNLRTSLKRESELSNGPQERAITNHYEPHQPHHDIESFYQVFLWAYIQLQARHPHPQDTDSSYHDFNQNMSRNKPAKGDWRVYHFFTRNDMDEPIQPKSEQFERLFRDMSLYLQFPWKEYEPEVKLDHAHTAFLRLLLLEIGKIHLHVKHT